MKIIWRILLLALAVLLILAAHIFVINFLPEPFNRINIIFSVIFLLLTATSNKKTLWLALILSYFSELFSSIPLGIGMTALIVSLFIINWFQLNILTNHSMLMVLLSAVGGIILYRTLFVIFLAIYNYLILNKVLPYKEIAADTLWEIFLSSAVIFLAYALGRQFLNHSRWNKLKSKSMYG